MPIIMQENATKKEINKFEKFLEVMEVLYAVSMTWGLARLAEYFTRSPEYYLSSLIAGFVLIRFFFAPAHNLYDIAIESRNHPVLQRVIFLFDIPIMIFHSFVYYRMCYSISQRNYAHFYELLFVLLIINAAWLIAIDARIGFIAKKLCWKHIFWIVNNIVSSSVFYLTIILAPAHKMSLFAELHYWPFFIALVNCIIDFILTAPYYLGYKE